MTVGDEIAKAFSELVERIKAHADCDEAYGCDQCKECRWFVTCSILDRLDELISMGEQ